VKTRIAWLAGTATVLVLAVAPAAQAASVTASRPCYVYDGGQRPLVLDAGGFAPNHGVELRSGSRLLATDTTNASGRVVHAFTVRELYRGRLSQRFRVTVSDGTTSASTSFAIERFDASIMPRSGRPDRRVRVSLFGWGPATMYLHYVAPHHHRALRTVRLGRTRGTAGGQCGHVVVRLRHLYPFRARTGTWRLQFDTHRAYRSHSVPRIVYNSRIFAF